jgi:beta-D-galactosyl-(1->4)-L-rhamnose phosphorylase
MTENERPSNNGHRACSNKGGFTLPGEAGHEKLTLELAERWGADVIRDSDGTGLSSELLESGYGIYSTICIVREHNEWIRANPLARQQTFLCTPAVVAEGETLTIRLLDGFFEEQFQINDTADALESWQVYDRTAGTEVPRDRWRYSAGMVCVDTLPWRQYTVSFLAWRIWEEISMYNHTTNNWDKEHLMQLNPYRREALYYLREWLTSWCKSHPRTDVVRFTSLFYNFAWIWGASARNRNLFVDWASYDFTVCPEALADFAAEYGYALIAEDFVRNGKYNATHRLPDYKKKDWMEFIGRFVRKAMRELTDIVHKAGKRAYVFYDDNWLGLEPYNGFFNEFGFDGLIKCVFSGYEARLCAGVAVDTHEIRFHPYLFPVGLGGLPTFSPGGKPGEDALAYWVSVRRALLRSKIERCGLGGYLSLTRDYPDFIKAMDGILDEFRIIKGLHDSGAPLSLPPRIAVLHTWGKLRTWTLSGHFHETGEHVLIHVLESLSGLPFEVNFLSFEDIKGGVPDGIDVIINAGAAGDAWSGGGNWEDADIVEHLTAWVHKGGVFFGIGEPSALPGGYRYLRMAHVLGADIDNGEYACHGKWEYDVSTVPGLIPENYTVLGRNDVRLIDGLTQALAERDGTPSVCLRSFGRGKGLYLADFSHGLCSPRFLQNLILFATEGNLTAEGVSDNPYVECAVYKDAEKIAFINNSPDAQSAGCMFNGQEYRVTLNAFEMKVL